MRNQIDNTDEDNVAEDVFMGSYLREKTNGFSGSRGGTVYITGNETMIRESIDVYDSGFGVVKFHYHRHIQRSGDATGRILAIRPEKIEKSWLHKAFIARPSLDAPADARVIVGAATLKTHNQDANWFASGFFKG